MTWLYYTVAGRKMWKNSKDAQILILGICGNVSLHVKRDFANVINLRILKWQYILDYPARTNVIQRVLLSERGRQENQRERYDNGKRGQTDVIVGFEDGRGPEAKEYGQPLETQKSKRMDSPLEPPEGNWRVSNLLTH